eukprot:g268.t1
MSNDTSPFEQRSTDVFEKLLPDEDPYLFDKEDAGEDDFADSDYNDTFANKRQRGPRVKHEDEEKRPSGRRRRKDTGQHRGRGRPWTTEEEELFREALELYGRDWKRCAEHIGTRDSKAVTSHAQKHFVKLCIIGKPVPEKVAESGLGYTLSGRLLDPDSRSAHAYGFRKETIKALAPDEYATVSAGIMVEKLDVKAEEEEEETGVGQDWRQVRNWQSTHNGVLSFSDTLVPRTEYALNRPQRAATRNRKIQMGNTSESLQLVECEEFMKSSENGQSLQPFTLHISAQVLLLMDFHSHLSEFEVIGLLAGHWDRDRRHLSILEALPCQRESGSEDRISVELDPISEVAARAQMVEKGLVGTGWYHSHPVFSATPSMKDIENQRNYQYLFRDDLSQLEPFVGLIVSPYDVELASPQSRICAFYIQQQNHGIKPFRLDFEIIDYVVEIPTELKLKFDYVIEMMKGDPSQMDLSSLWRKWSFHKGSQKTGDALSKAKKLQLSLLMYFNQQSMESSKLFIKELLTQIEEQWNVRLVLNDNETEKDSTQINDGRS